MKRMISLPNSFARVLPMRLPRSFPTTLPKPDFRTIGVGTIVVSLLGAAIVHILATFAVPALWRGAAFDRMQAALPANGMRVLARQGAAAQVLPYLAADMGYAVCRYDLTVLPVAVRAVLPDAGWSLTLYTPSGENFYAQPASDGKRTEVAFLLVPSSDRLFNIQPGVRRADVDATQVTSPQREGLIVVRGPRRGIAYDAEVEAALALASCQPIQR